MVESPFKCGVSNFILLEISTSCSLFLKNVGALDFYLQYPNIYYRTYFLYNRSKVCNNWFAE